MYFGEVADFQLSRIISSSERLRANQVAEESACWTDDCAELLFPSDGQHEPYPLRPDLGSTPLVPPGAVREGLPTIQKVVPTTQKRAFNEVLHVQPFALFGIRQFAKYPHVLLQEKGSERHNKHRFWRSDDASDDRLPTACGKQLERVFSGGLHRHDQSRQVGRAGNVTSLWQFHGL